MKPFGARLNFENYKIVLSTVNMSRYMLNTAFVTICVVIGQIITSMMGRYVFARINFPGRDILFRIYLGTIMIPFVVIMIPIYKMMQLFSWLDKFQSLIIPWIFTAAGTFLFCQFFKSIPKDLEEAAIIDGASRWTILWRIFAQLSIPAIATQATISFLYAWNSFI
jgi:ABC-type glycerol-3-phosphate transport system permease component